MPLVVIRSTYVTIVLTSCDLSDWAMVGYDECPAFERLAQLAAEKVQRGLAFCDHIGRPQPPIIDVGPDHFEVVHFSGTRRRCGYYITRGGKISPASTDQEPHVADNQRLVFQHAHVRSRCRFHLFDRSVDVAFVMFVVPGAIDHWTLEGLICPQNPTPLETDITSQYHQVCRHLWWMKWNELEMEVGVENYLHRKGAQSLATRA